MERAQAILDECVLLCGDSVPGSLDAFEKLQKAEWLTFLHELIDGGPVLDEWLVDYTEIFRAERRGTNVMYTIRVGVRGFDCNKDWTERSENVAVQYATKGFYLADIAVHNNAPVPVAERPAHVCF